MEPIVDPSQDYSLLLGYENNTHTVLRFQRKIVTCDISHDIPITVSYLIYLPQTKSYIKDACIYIVYAFKT